MDTLLPSPPKVEIDFTEVTSRVMCQGDGGADSLRFVFVYEDGEEDAVH